MNWRQLTSLSQLQEIKELSEQQPVAIFKHSTRCSISSMAKNRLESEWHFSDENLPIYYLDLLNCRDVSAQIATDFDVYHASPQIVVIKNGKSIYDNSHMGISVADIVKSI